MAALDFWTFQLRQAPTWFAAPAGSDWWTLWGQTKDVCAEAAKEAVKARFPSLAAYDALEVQAVERNTERYPLESESAFRVRLAESFDRWTWGGTPQGVIDAAAATPGVTSVGYFEAWQWDPGSERWARFWLVLESTWSEPPDWDDDGLVFDSDESDFLFDLTADRESIEFLRRQVRRWKAAHAKCESALVLIGDGHVFDEDDLLWGEGDDELIFDAGDVVALEV